MAITKITTPELFDFSATNTALQLPTGTTLQRPTNAIAGEWRYNTDEKYVEFYDGTTPYDAAKWFQIDTEATANPDDFPGQNFQTVIYSGNGSTQAITDAGFKPDLVWIKKREGSGYYHQLYDSVRGAGEVIFSNDSLQQYSRPTGLTSFDSNGFTLGANTNSNEIPGTFVAWNWKGGGPATTITAGTEGNTIASDVSANVAAGFSIVSYTGNNTAGATISHGLSSAPELIIQKRTEASASWFVYSLGIGNTKYLVFDANLASSSAVDVWNNTDPTDKVFTVSDFGDVNGSGISSIAYCFHSVLGYSKIGTYTGTGNVNNQITTGFEVAFLLIKNSSNTGYWQIFDNARNPNNQIWNALYPNDSGAEGGDFLYTYVNFSSNGFIINDPGVFTGDTNMNVAGDTYIYYAVAADKSSTPALAKSFDVNTYAGNGTNKAIINGAKDSFPQSASYNGTGVYNAGGTANISIPGLGGSYYDSAFSISLWFLTPMRNAGSAGYLISGGGSRDFFMNIDDDGTGLINGRFFSGGSLYSITTSYNLNTWYNIVFTYSGNGVTGGMKLYANNVLRTSSAYNSGGQTLALNDSIGGRTDVRNDLNANMCQVRYFDKELSASEVTTVYNETTTAGTLDVLGDGSCVRLYRLNGDASVIDSSGTQTNAGTPGAMVNWGSGPAFKPDLSIVKAVGGGTGTSAGDASWSWVDDLRSVSAQLRSNTTNDQTRSLGYYQKALYENGLSVGDNSTGDYGVNGGPNSTYGDTYVTYNFKAGGLSKIDDISVSGATIQSNYSANADAGMSFVNYKGNGIASQTVAHGMGSAPEMVIFKNITIAGDNWIVFHDGMTGGANNQNFMILNSTAAETSLSTIVNLRTASTISIGTSDTQNSNNRSYIAYCFHSVSGFSKFGSYEGNNPSAVTVSLDFTPSFVMIKNVDTASNWAVYDTARSPSNNRDKIIAFDTSNAEVTTGGNFIQINTNEFVTNGSGGDGSNKNGDTFIYWAMKIN
tara:strand:- start:48 stop:3032 length:2985 start_codon:yes stop_codon:yes gene_type:complete